ncbi:hypothetical protein L249_1758 [Ophiocordyceps polyrhachis-furcata BCC 54312]|uniref:GH16 domain-containing protein n=1 Tax=Ophiocordyceps polyrhachis-furcata BCC 54312 TaxID=1330021 RepID=A0A367LRT2_9HYPO|nr:hypothetical protein L249_1758 [Ophiocordyceps polyrhachis-furcata BCC 54312]
MLFRDIMVAVSFAMGKVTANHGRWDFHDRNATSSKISPREVRLAFPARDPGIIARENLTQGLFLPILFNPLWPAGTNLTTSHPLDWLGYPLNENSSLGVKIMRTLPVGLRIDIAQSKGWDAATFIAEVDYALSLLPNVKAVKNWYIRHGSVGQRICWDKDVPSVLDSHSNVVGGLSSLIVRPEQVRYDLPARRFYPDLPPWYMARGSPHCINKSNPHYETVRKVILNSLSFNFHPRQTGADYLDIVRCRLRDYAHPMLRAIYYASLKNYECPYKKSCFWYSATKGKHYRTMTPPNFFGFAKVLQGLFRNREPICLLFGNIPAPVARLLPRNVSPTTPDGFTRCLFHDDFTDPDAGSLPSSAKWTLALGTSYPGGAAQWGTGEVQNYTKTNIQVTADSTLLITPSRQQDGSWTSSRIETTVDWDFACQPNHRIRVEARIKLGDDARTKQLGIWPAFWALGASVRKNPTAWPTIGEVDVMETANGDTAMRHAVHCGVAPGGPCNEFTGIGTVTESVNRGEWHVYAWEVDRRAGKGLEILTWFVDGSQRWRMEKQAIANDDGSAWDVLVAGEKMLLLNVAVGGAFPDALAGGKTPTDATAGGRGASMETGDRSWEELFWWLLGLPNITWSGSDKTWTDSRLRPQQFWSHLLGRHASFAVAMPDIVLSGAAGVTTPFGDAVPPAPRHAITVHMPGFATAERFGKDPPSVIAHFKSVYPRMRPHQDIARLIDAVLARLHIPERACLLFASRQSADECVAYASSPKREDGCTKHPVSPELMSVHAFIAKDVFFAVVFPPEARTVVGGFWVTPGCGVSSRFAEANLRHLDQLAEIGDKTVGRPGFDGLDHRLLRERIIALLARAPLVRSPPRQQPGPSIGDVYFFQTGMASIYKTHSYLLSLHQGTTVLFGMAFMNTVTIFEEFGSSYKFFGLGTDQELDELGVFLEGERSHGRKVQAIWTEFPANPLLVTPDLIRLRSLADEHDVVLAVDDTIGGYANVDVFHHADLLVTSMTKSFNGYADVIAGAVVLNPSRPKYRELKPLFERCHVSELYVDDAKAIERNSRDYLSRCGRLNDNALALVQHLNSYSKDPASSVRHVFYPSVNDSRQYYERFMRPATTDFSPGYGCLFSVELADVASAKAFYDNLAVHKGPHLGAPFTLAFAYTVCGYMTRLDWAAGYGLKPTQIRVSAGLEDTETLIELFSVAVEAANRARERRG